MVSLHADGHISVLVIYRRTYKTRPKMLRKGRKWKFGKTVSNGQQKLVVGVSQTFGVGFAYLLPQKDFTINFRMVRMALVSET